MKNIHYFIIGHNLCSLLKAATLEGNILLKSIPTWISSSDLLTKRYKEPRTEVLKHTLFVEPFFLISLIRRGYFSASKIPLRLKLQFIIILLLN